MPVVKKRTKFLCPCCKTHSMFEVMEFIIWCELCHWTEYEMALDRVHNKRLIAHVRECRYTKRRVVPKLNVHNTDSSSVSYADVSS